MQIFPGSVQKQQAAALWTLLAANIKKLEYILPTFSYRDAFFALMILFFFYKVPCRWPEHVPRLSCRIPAVLAAFFLVFGYSFRYTNSWDLIFMDSFHLLISGVVFAGYYVLAVRLFQMVIRYLCKKAQESKTSCGKWTTLLFETHAFAGPLLVIMIFWSSIHSGKISGSVHAGDAGRDAPVLLGNHQQLLPTASYDHAEPDHAAW